MKTSFHIFLLAFVTWVRRYSHLYSTICLASFVFFVFLMDVAHCNFQKNSWHISLFITYWIWTCSHTLLSSSSCFLNFHFFSCKYFHNSCQHLWFMSEPYIYICICIYILYISCSTSQDLYRLLCFMPAVTLIQQCRTHLLQTSRWGYKVTKRRLLHEFIQS